MQTRQAEKFVNSNRHYSLRKLSVGLASVLIGISFLNGTKTTVKADTITASTKTGEVSKAGNLEVASDSKDLSAFSMHFNRKNGENETAKADTTSDQTMQTGDQAEAKNQENRLADQINYKLTNDGGTDSKEDLGQNLTVPDETKQVPTTKNDAEKNITGSSSAQQTNNQSNDHAEDNSQPQTSQKLDLTKNSKIFAKKVLTTNLIETTSSPTTNGGFDEATWGKLDVNNWQGFVQDGLYQLTGYSGDLSHVIVPNEADFEKAGKSTNCLQVGITRDTVRSIFSETDQDQITIAFSKTNNQKVKAIGTDWSNAFSADDYSSLSKFDGSNLDVSNVTNMSYMFSYNPISDLTSLSNWDTSKVTNMSNMFEDNTISDLTPLANWNVSNVRNMGDMFKDNSISNLTPLVHWDKNKVTIMSGMFSGNKISDLTPLANWDTSKVTIMSGMFDSNSISDLTPLTHWDVSNVTEMNYMFEGNSISNLAPLTNWKVSNVTEMDGMFETNKISNLTPLANWDVSNVIDMDGMFETNKISDLTPLANWKVSNVTEMTGMFETNKISDLTPLANWDISKVTSMNSMFRDNKVSNLTPLTHWDVNNVTSMSLMFAKNPDITDLGPIANWNISNALSNIYNNDSFVRLFASDFKLNLTNINNTSLMQGFLKKTDALQSASFITNNADLVKATTGKDLPNLTNTAKRTIVFNLPHATPKTIVQIINYKTIAPVQIDWSDPDSSKIVQTYPVKESDWYLDTSKQNDDVIIDGVICFKPVKIPHVNGYKAHLIKDPINPTAFLVSFMALSQQSQNNQSNNVQSSQKPAQPEQKQPEPIQTKPAPVESDKKVDQIIDHIAYALMHDSSDNADSFEPVQDDSASLEASSDSTQKDDAAKIVNVAKPKKHIVKKHVVKCHKKHAKKYHLKRRSRKHTKHAKKRMIKHRKRASRKFRKHGLKKHIKKA